MWTQAPLEAGATSRLVFDSPALRHKEGTMAKAKTFDDYRTVVVEILAKPSSTGLCKVQMPDGRVVARHKDRLDPLDDDARDLLGR